MAQNIFESIGLSSPPYSGFDLSREQKLSGNMGYLIPTYLEEVIPGDSFKVKTEMLMRVAPMSYPIMHRVDVKMEYFYVPNYLVWNEFEDFITGGVNGNASPAYPIFTLNDTVASSKLSDYLGVPKPATGISTTSTFISQIPYRAYLKIWNEYYRDENLDAEIDVETATQAQLLTLRKRAWAKDYFTSALPWAQRGGGNAVAAPVQFNYKQPATGSPAPASTSSLQILTNGEIKYGSTGVSIQNIESGSMSVLINELRKTSAIQKWFERSARGGYRYVEQLWANFKVKSDDLRLMRPQYLGGGKQPIVISEVLNTTGTVDAPQGEMAGHGYSSGTINGFSESFKYHGYVIGIMSVIPKRTYQNGIPKHFNRFSKFDYYFPDFANLGEQEIKNKEMWFDPNNVAGYNDATFAYQQRYGEMKYGCNTVHGEFRTTLNDWHMGENFTSAVNLNSDFITCNPTHRIFAVEDPEIDKLYIQLYHSVQARRPMPYFSDPRLS